MKRKRSSIHTRERREIIRRRPKKHRRPSGKKNLLMKTGSHKTIPSIPQSAEKQKARRAENRAFGAKPAQKGRFTCQAEQIGYNVKQNAAPG